MHEVRVLTSPNGEQIYARLGAITFVQFTQFNGATYTKVHFIGGSWELVFETPEQILGKTDAEVRPAALRGGGIVADIP